MRTPEWGSDERNALPWVKHIEQARRDLQEVWNYELPPEVAELVSRAMDLLPVCCQYCGKVGGH